MKERAQQRDRPAVQGDRLDLGQRPAESAGRQREGGGSGKHLHLFHPDVASERGADAVAERIAGSQHADFSTAQRQHRVHPRIEGLRPGPRLAANRLGGEGEMTGSAEDDFGFADTPLGRVAETV